MTGALAEDPCGGALVSFALDRQHYAIRLDDVRRSIRVLTITPLPGAPEIVLGIVNLGGEVLPVIDLRTRFGHPRRDVCLSDHLLIAMAGTRWVALRVDETLGVLDIPRKEVVSIDALLPGLRLVDGTIRCEDGLILIHDLRQLLSLDEGSAIDHALTQVAVGTGAIAQ
ncbi:MAG: chemotaxis protein CheW [Myxococcota bacterium]